MGARGAVYVGVLDDPAGAAPITHPASSWVGSGAVSISRDGGWVVFGGFPNTRAWLRRCGTAPSLAAARALSHDLRCATLWIARSDGTGMRPLAADAAEGLGASFSPDGARVAYVSARCVKYEQQDDGRWGCSLFTDAIAVVRADGTGERVVFAKPRRDPATPDWSPDGRMLVFELRKVRDPYFGGVRDNSELWLMGSDGSHPHFLARALTSGEGRGAVYDPRFSPDSKVVAFTADDAINGFVNVTMALVGVDGSGRRSTGVTFSGAWIGRDRAVILSTKGSRTGFSIWNTNQLEDGITPIAGFAPAFDPSLVISASAGDL